jgi:DNA-binding PadR family transcriptional regulator
MIDIIAMVMPKIRLNPLPMAAFHILLSLADEDLHGYEIMRRVEAHTDGRMRMGPGTLYSSVQALLEAGFISEVAPRGTDDVADGRRRYYRLTAAGRSAARDEAERLADTLRLARARKILRGGHV